jgi:hypothetical protein
VAVATIRPAPREKGSAAPRRPKLVTPASVPPQTPGDESAREKKTDIYNERVTVLLNAELRDAAESIARDLHRKRKQKGERITANTVMRVAIRTLFEIFDTPQAEGVSTEEELLDAVRAQIGKKR